MENSNLYVKRKIKTIKRKKECFTVKIVKSKSQHTITDTHSELFLTFKAAIQI